MNFPGGAKHFLIPAGGLILAFLLASVDFGADLHYLPLDEGPAALGSAAEESPDEPARGEIFSVPISVSWKAEVVGCLMGCSGYILKRIDNSDEETIFQGFNADGGVRDLSGEVEIEGMWIGMDCGYSNTVFKGKCAPSVVIDAIRATED